MFFVVLKNVVLFFITTMMLCVRLNYSFAVFDQRHSRILLDYSSAHRRGLTRFAMIPHIDSFFSQGINAKRRRRAFHYIPSLLLSAITESDISNNSRDIGSNSSSSARNETDILFEEMRTVLSKNISVSSYCFITIFIQVTAII